MFVARHVMGSITRLLLRRGLQLPGDFELNLADRIGPERD
jgi:hypothetical protein